MLILSRKHRQLYKLCKKEHKSYTTFPSTKNVFNFYL